MLTAMSVRLECAKTAACRPHVHEYEECVARVTAAAEDENHPEHHRKEDCVEECKFTSPRLCMFTTAHGKFLASPCSFQMRLAHSD